MDLSKVDANSADPLFARRYFERPLAENEPGM